MKIIALLLASVEASKLASQSTSVPPGGFFGDYGDEYGDEAITGIDSYSLADSGLIDLQLAMDYDSAVVGFNDAIEDYEYAAEELNARTEEINDALNGDDWDGDYYGEDADSTSWMDDGTTWDFDMPDYDDGTFVESGDSNWDYYIDPETGAYLPVNGGTEEPEEDIYDTCFNTDFGITNDYSEDCGDYDNNPSWCGMWNNDEFISESMCCVCGGGESITDDSSWEDNFDDLFPSIYNDLPDYDDGTFVESGDSNWDYYIDPETGAYLPVNGGTEEPEEDFDWSTHVCYANEDNQDKYGDPCAEYWNHPHWCESSSYNTATFDMEDCCAC